MSWISRAQSENLQTFSQDGFNVCCLLTGVGSLFCIYIGFPSPDACVRFWFRFFNVGFFTCTVVGFSYGYESSSVIKKAAFHLAFVFCSGGFGLCSAYWMDGVPRFLLLIMGMLSCLFQAVCVHFQLEGTGLVFHPLLTALMPAFVSVGTGAGYDVSKDSLSIVFEQEARILQAEYGESGEAWASKIIVAAVCVVVFAVLLAVCRVWRRRHALLRQKAQRVVKWHDATVGRTIDRDDSSSVEESKFDLAKPMEIISDDGSGALPADSSVPGRLDSTNPGITGDEHAQSLTTTSTPRRSPPSVTQLDEVADASRTEDKALNVDQVDVQVFGFEERPMISDSGNAGKSLARMMQVLNASGSMNSDVVAPKTDEPDASAFDGLQQLHDDLMYDLLTLSESSCGSREESCPH
eukprot:TRINITY_DN34133_c0_g1_i1.p1 TRINITY_DN34133_c0_g1~~TRINITY_DN34133_c0_g1_i1.p1  ORF type:complete len:408 (+),score=49.66 TRINITY_DN34133_c0_g1_i1:73-1296(+)